MFETNEKFREAIGFNKYKDTITLALFQHGSDGKDYLQWSTKEVGKEKKVVKLPVGLQFESEAQLKEFAAWLMNEVNPEPIPQPDTTEDCPF